MNNPFDYIPDQLCRKAYQNLVASLEQLKSSSNPDDISFFHELDEGKMLGILIAEDESGIGHTLYAFSGQLGVSGFKRHGFVEPVLDYLAPDGYFKTTERYISAQNKKIASFETHILAEAQKALNEARMNTDKELTKYKEFCRQSKQKREEIRRTGVADEKELASLIRQSQFEKAELHRIKKRIATQLEPLVAAVNKARSDLSRMKEKRRQDSENLQNWLFDNTVLLNAEGERMSVNDIFRSESFGVPPSGTGECCAPKLLQAAYTRGWRPISIAEFWYGKPKGGELRIHGSYYPACRGKCWPLLKWMLNGLDITPPIYREHKPAVSREPKIIFSNTHLCIVDKPEGMLSVPGKGDDISLQQWLETQFGKDSEVKLAHRLDRDTSGLVIATFGLKAYKTMQSLFAQRLVKKIYEAVLDGDYTALGLPQQGTIDLPILADYLNRPRQKVDEADGKPAVTAYKFLNVKNRSSRIEFSPLTGRTHQLRVHAASDMGLGMPIIGDPLYGKNPGKHNTRMMLHARNLQFTFPLDGKSYSFESLTPF